MIKTNNLVDLSDIFVPTSDFPLKSRFSDDKVVDTKLKNSYISKKVFLPIRFMIKYLFRNKSFA